MVDAKNVPVLNQMLCVRIMGYYSALKRTEILTSTNRHKLVPLA